jgi:AraC-like DNA-binding protein
VRYREASPIAPLADVVDRVWTLEGVLPPGGGAPEPVLPDGRPELVLHLGDPFERCDDGAHARQASCLFAGQVTRPLVLRPTGRVAVVGVRFHPHGAAALFDAPQHELAGLTPGLDVLAPSLRRALREVEDWAGDLTAAADAVQRVLVRWMNPSRIDPRVRFVAAEVGRTRGLASIDALARAAGLTRRHLERRFLDGVGMAPKRLARIARFQHALRVLQQPMPRGRGALTAATCGYADQSHFIRDFRELAGCPPGEHLLRQGQLTGFFIS